MAKAFILCAGRGERLWPLSTVLPKCLWPIGGKPCVRHIVERLPLLSVDGAEHYEVYICCLEKDLPLYKHEFRDLVYGVKFLSTSEPLGTAGQLVPAQKDYPPIPLDEPFLIHYGDCLVDVDFTDLLKVHRESRASATLVLSNRVRSEFGQVKLMDAGGYKEVQVVQFQEKPFLQGWTWTGIAVLNPDVVQYLGVSLDFGKDVFPQLLSKGALIYPYKVEKSYYDIGTIRAYTDVNVLAEGGRLFE